MAVKKPTPAKALRGRSTFVIEIRPDLVVRMRRLTMMDLVLERLIPLNLLAAATKFEEIKNKADQAVKDGLIDEKPVDPEKDPFTDKTTDETKEFLKRYAVAVVVEPVMVMEEDGNEEHVPVTELSYEDLMAIFLASPSAKEVSVTKNQAEDFRRPEPAAAAPVLGTEPDVRTTTELVDTPEREYIHG